MATAVREVLSSLVGAQPTDTSDDADSAVDPGDRLGAALAAWRRTREQVIDGLDELSAAIAYAKYEESDKAIILLRAVRAQITVSPDTLRKVEELDRYLKSDPVIGHAEMKNGFGVEVRIREPLLAALAALKPHLPQ